MRANVCTTLHCSGVQLHCTEPFIIDIPLSQYDINKVKRDVNQQIEASRWPSGQRSRNEVAGLNPAGEGIQLMTVGRFILDFRFKQL